MVKYEIKTKEFKLILEETPLKEGVIKMELSEGQEATFKFKEYNMADELYKYLLKGFYENTSN